MKFKVGDRVLITAGKDKGKKSVIVALLPREDKVIVKDVNLYVKHIKPFMDKPGEKVQRERAMSVAKIAILNDKDQADRLAIRSTTDGKKERFFKKTGQVAPTEKIDKAVKIDEKAKKKSKKASAVAENIEGNRLAQEAIRSEQKAINKATAKASKVTRVRKTQDKG